MRTEENLNKPLGLGGKTIKNKYSFIEIPFFDDCGWFKL